MKIYLYILIMIIISCDRIKEIEESLPYEFSILEGWLHFENGDYDLAEVMFSDILNIEANILPYDSYSEAYLGLGWADLYEANTLIGTDNFSNRKSLRESAKNSFLNAQSDIISNNLIVVPEIQIILPDLYAGLAYTNSSLALYEDFSDINDYGAVIDSALEHSRLVLELDSSYYFIHDSININYNGIHLLRSQLFIEQNNFDMAEIEISQIDIESHTITFDLNIEKETLDAFPVGYDIFLYPGFSGQNKHYFQMDEVTDSSYTLTRSFSPILPCMDIIDDDIDLSNDEVIECISSFPTNILEYKFTIRIPGSVLEGVLYEECQALDPNNIEFEFLSDYGCVQYIFIDENLVDESCLSNGYRTLEIISSGLINSCYNSCIDCGE